MFQLGVKGRWIKSIDAAVKEGNKAAVTDAESIEVPVGVQLAAIPVQISAFLRVAWVAIIMELIRQCRPEDREIILTTFIT